MGVMVGGCPPQAQLSRALARAPFRKILAENFGCYTHSYKEEGVPRTFAWLPIDEINLSHINKKLNLGKANTFLLENI